MLRHGPIPAFIHGLLEYGAGALLIASPFLFDFDSDGATALAIILGVAVLVIAASSEGTTTSLAKAIPTGIHIVLDIVLAALLIAAPFLFGFSDESGPTALFIILGVAFVLLTIGTRYRRPAG